MKANLTLLSLCLAMTACVYNEELADVADLHSTKQSTSLAYSMQHTVKAGETDGSRSIPDEASPTYNSALGMKCRTFC